jgi:hypothetical protein
MVAGLLVAKLGGGAEIVNYRRRSADFEPRKTTVTDVARSS